jgi:hypothetical protein
MSMLMISLLMLIKADAPLINYEVQKEKINLEKSILFEQKVDVREKKIDCRLEPCVKKVKIR